MVRIITLSAIKVCVKWKDMILVFHLLTLLFYFKIIGVI